MSNLVTTGTLPQSVAAMGIDEPTWNALKNSIYPGARDDSVVMAVSYCVARQLDPLMKPVHLVPMSVKDAQSGKNEWRDVVMPGIGLYRIQADRSGSYAGANEPEFGDDITKTLNGVEITFPAWCKYTVCKSMPDGKIVEFSAKEYWMENYATAGRDNPAPNAMWKKRPYGQLAKCAEAQALRKAWPEIGQQPTAEEMEGKSLDISDAKDVTPHKETQTPLTLPHYPADKFNQNLPGWQKMIESGSKKADAVIATVSTKFTLSEAQTKAIRKLEPIDANH
ncbi:phage recombination protein Bet [Serratia quinivorans]|uniref:phage recombination protein Bet n=1 Tax=Serratia quinivorans TaxID=137545 RepID=UPI00217CACA2|nr:phage recombination protein Bet [Serratia quinivorans]CAI0844178.1 phage recombination protein Bet [Serratia quinivorans]CAI0892882.1 phage recombination protein Bet [Serratia quinivorans]CAI1683183.1 phage recombination protein Bet [Serratia quinivorans]CAI2081159.1 phage recombination protein Bet [Serratia quinivorans]CAI2438018.1 phage recombination protein Bet [Serratia quinivorans]